MINNDTNILLWIKDIKELINVFNIIKEYKLMNKKVKSKKYKKQKNNNK